MTHGIIQEVFDKHLSDKKIHLGDYSMCKIIQQELIEKIKQNPIVDYNNRCGCFGCKFIDYMIGDNQE